MTDNNKKKVSDIKKVNSEKNTQVKNSKPETKKSIGKKSSITEKSVTNKKSGDNKPAINTKTNGKKQLSKIKELTSNEENEPIDPSALARGDEPMTIVEHLDELRSRLIVIIISFFILASVAFYFSDFLITFINKPFQQTGNKLNVFTLVGGFIIKMKVAAAIALIILIPLILFHVWRFISPAIEKPTRYVSRSIIISSITLFYAGVIFVFLILPSMVKVLLSFIDTSMLSTIDANDYLHFIFFMSCIMGFLSELPILVLLLTKIGLITPQFLISKRKYAVIIIWITAAIVTPGPDFLSQSLVGVPLMFLYEISIIVSKFVLVRKKRKELKLRNT